MRTRILTLLVAVAAVVAGIAAAPAPTLTTSSAALASAPEGSTWYETWITTPDGEDLHVDVMRPEGLDDSVQTPVILVVSPYLGLGSSVVVANVPSSQAPGPVDRFFDFYEGAQVFDRGYTVVQVSLRGTGGSSGCLDILGPGEQLDVATAVEFARTAPFSTGHVGMYGKSYDANTGAVAAALGPEGLDAIVAQAIAPDRYRGSYNDRVRLLQSLLYPTAAYGLQGEGGFSSQNDTRYIANSVSHSADCQVGLLEHYLDDESAHFWRVRDFVDRAQRSEVPTFITTGYLDNATNIGAGALDLFNSLQGPKKLWIGWWEHVRGNDMDGGRLLMGRAGFFDEVMRFFDHHVKKVPLEDAPWTDDPIIAAQSNDGTWRSETQWPAADAVALEGALLSGTFEDDGRNQGTQGTGFGPGGFVTFQPTRGHGTWTFSPPLEHAAHLGGLPTATVDVTPVVPRTNVVVNLYDVAPDGRATYITRGAALVDAAGPKDITLWPTDWKFAAGHRVGVLVSGANGEAYTHVPTRTTVTVNGGSVSLPWLTYERVSDIQGDSNPRLESFLASAPFPVTDDPPERTSEDFTLPAPLQPKP
ncbi:MAG: CocE/NonD family hydrolase [Actinobacteria bacterium]|nr:CocE/NonD family hydrolase [Actinomycetota bacterium]